VSRRLLYDAALLTNQTGVSSLIHRFLFRELRRASVNTQLRVASGRWMHSKASRPQIASSVVTLLTREIFVSRHCDRTTFTAVHDICDWWWPKASRRDEHDHPPSVVSKIDSGRWKQRSGTESDNCRRLCTMHESGRIPINPWRFSVASGADCYLLHYSVGCVVAPRQHCIVALLPQQRRL